MDYFEAPIFFRVRKVARYVRLYGPRRTLAKVRSQYHMRSADRPPVPLRRPGRKDAHVGVIGCGKFAYTTIAFYLAHRVGAVMRGAMDRHEGRAASLARRYRLHYATDDASAVIEDPNIDLIYIASNHASHADYAIRALSAGKSVHIEKPHVVDEEQLVRLCRAMVESGGSVRVGFNRPESRLAGEIRELLDSQRGPAIFNWFVVGHEIPPDHWYLRPEEGGRVVANLCHWTDFLLQLVPPEDRFPIQIKPARAESPDTDVAVSYVFGDGTIAAITFSAKGHTFEGVREHLSLNRADLILSMADFRDLVAQVRERRQRTRLRFRDHGHAGSILRSYQMSERAGRTEPGYSVEYLWDTGQLYLKTREALEMDTPITLDAYSPSVLESKQPSRRPVTATVRPAS